MAIAGIDGHHRHGGLDRFQRDFRDGVAIDGSAIGPDLVRRSRFESIIYVVQRTRRHAAERRSSYDFPAMRASLEWAFPIDKELRQINELQHIHINSRNMPQ